MESTSSLEVVGSATSPPDLSFADVISDPEILAAVERLGFQKPTPIQQRSIPPALQNRDLILQARTGSGKTYAFVIPLIALLRAMPERQETVGLIVVPTRELAVQVNEAISSLSTAFRPACLIGGANIDAQINDLRRDPRIVVGTPGRILDLIRQRILKLNRCRYFVLDEADEMLSTGFLEDIRAILSRLPDQRQGIFASATVTPRVDMLANSFLTRPLHVFVDVSERDLPPVEHFYCDVPGDLISKPNILCDFIETWRPTSALIFCNTKSDTQLVEVLLRRRGFDARRLNSDLTQAKRNQVMRLIRDGELQFVVATDIAARGIDIEQLEMVVNYAIHEQSELYIHRTGRTGRAGRSGKALSLVGPRDFGSFHYLRKVIDVNFQQLPPPSDDEVANARLAHVYEILRGVPGELATREQLVARKFIREMVPMLEEVPEEFESVVAKLIRHIVEHHVRQEAKSLDEEFGEEESPSERGPDRRRRGNDRNDREEQPRHEHRRRHDDERNERRSEPPRRRESRDQPERSAEGSTRLYIGQGLVHGMTPDIFVDLVGELADLPPGALKHLVIREHYGFVDVPPHLARRLIDNMNGIEYNGADLPIEIAAEIKPEHRRSEHPRSGDDRGRDRRRRDHRHDDDRGRGRRHRDRS